MDNSNDLAFLDASLNDLSLQANSRAAGIGRVDPAELYAKLRVAARYPHLCVMTGDSLQSRGNYNVAITNATAVANTVTIVATLHSAYPGAYVTISNFNEEAFNGVFLVTSVIDVNTFTYTAVGTGTATATGSGTCILNSRFRDLCSFELANSMIGHPFTVLKNVSYPGKTIEYVAARFYRNVVLSRAHIVDIKAGTNNVINAASDGSDTDAVVETMKTAMALMLAQSANAGIIPVVYTVPPLGVTRDANFAIKNRIVAKYNSWLREFCMFVAQSAILVDLHWFGVNPTDANGEWASGMTTDGSHPTAKLIQLAATDLAVTLGKYSYLPTPWGNALSDNYANNVNLRNIIVNPLFTTSGGSFTGTGSTNTSHGSLWSATWTRGGGGAGAATSVLAARADGYGNDQKYTITSVNNNDKLSLVSNGLQARVTEGEIGYMEANVNLVSIVNLADMFFSIEWTANGINYSSPAAIGTGSDGQLSGTLNLTLRTTPFAIPANLTALKSRFWTTFGGAGGGEVRIGLVQWRKMSAINMSYFA